VDPLRQTPAIFSSPQRCVRVLASRNTNTLINKSPNPISLAELNSHQLERHARLSDPTSQRTRLSNFVRHPIAKTDRFPT
jgi:hypothetical protein